MIIRILFLLCLLTGCMGEEVSSDVDLVLESGDFVKVDFTERIKDTGEVFYTTFDSQYEPLEFTLGEGQIPPALEEGMIGMKIGEEKNITLTPEEGYGEWSPENTIALSRVAVLPKLTNMSFSTFRATAGKEPEVNETIQFNHWTAKVVNISNSNVTLLHEPDNNTVIDTEYGPAVVTLNDTHIIINIIPELGSVVTTAFGEEAVISDINATDFTLDFNHPLAGKTLIFEVRVRDIIKAEQMLAQKIVWTDYETGIERATNEKRPAIILLYLEGCQACEALDIITFSNPQVTELKDKFVWIKVDVAANPHTGSEYGATSYPTIVLLDRYMAVSKKITGYISPAELRKEIDTLRLAD